MGRPVKVAGGGLGEEEPTAKVGGGRLGGLPAVAKMEWFRPFGNRCELRSRGGEARRGAAAVYTASRTVHSLVSVVPLVCKLISLSLFIIIIRTYMDA